MIKQLLRNFKYSMNQADSFVPTQKSFFELQATDIDGNLITFDFFKQYKAILAVNVACKCGLTPQYAGLEKVYRKYQDKGFTIIGFPCNQFGAQEPWPEKEIKQWVDEKFHISFSLFSKIEVNGPKTHDVYKFLRYNSSLNNKGQVGYIGWNFGKFLIDRNGQVVSYINPQADPESLGAQIEKLLKD